MRSKLYVCVLAVMCSLMLCACGQKEAEKEKAAVETAAVESQAGNAPAPDQHPHKIPVPWLPV